MTRFGVAILSIFIGLTNCYCQSEMMYQDFYTRDWMSLGVGSYGRIGVSWTPNGTNVQGHRLNLSNMGSVGGRMEEQDYLELGLAFHIKPVNPTPDSLQINIQLRTAVYSRGTSLFGNSTTESLGGLTISLPEMYVEARNIFTRDLNIWVGARLYRGPDVHMADYFYFNDHSGQGAGIEFRNSRFLVNFVASTDTTRSVPPYFYLNIRSGTASLEIRERLVYILEHDLEIGNHSVLSLLAEFHRIGDPTDPGDSTRSLVSFPGDHGWVLGARLQQSILRNSLPGSFHQIGVRYGSGIANGGDGGSSRTWETFGAVDTVNYQFNNAYSWHIVDQYLLNISSKLSLNGYFVYNRSRGAATTEGLASTYLGRYVYNFKEDFTAGIKAINYVTDYFHMQTEFNYSQRRDGNQDWYRMYKLSLVPTLAVRGERSVWSRPHIRFIYSLARYNDLAVKNQYSPYLQLEGSNKWGHFFGIRAEWWTW